MILHVRPMAVTWVTTVNQMCVDYDSYLKIGPNQKIRGLDCRACQALFALRTTIIFQTSVSETLPYSKRANFDHCDIASKHTHTHTSPKRHNNEPGPTSMLLRLHYLQSANQMLVLFWAPSNKYITIILIEFTHFLTR